MGVGVSVAGVFVAGAEEVSTTSSRRRGRCIGRCRCARRGDIKNFRRRGNGRCWHGCGWECAHCIRNGSDRSGGGRICVAYCRTGSALQGDPRPPEVGAVAARLLLVLLFGEDTGAPLARGADRRTPCDS
jgi:hypothetical protein